MQEPPLIELKGERAYRIIPSRYPTIDLYEDVMYRIFSYNQLK